MATTRQVRDWALGKGWDVPTAGMLPKAIIAAYNAAHPDDPAAFGKGKPPQVGRFYTPNMTPEERSESARHASQARWAARDA